MARDIPRGEISNTNLRNICLQYSCKQLEDCTNCFHSSRRLGSGTTGTVYRGELADGSEVAVKVIDLATLGEDTVVAGFEDEISVMSKFRHPNLVVLMGWAREGSRRFLIYEYLTGGDVFQRLRKNKEKGLDCPFHWHERLAAARDAATGLAHLHNAEPRAFHRDVKSANILLGGNGSPAKMADFGLSCVAKSKDKDMLCELPSGTPGYTCPTYIKSGKVTEGSEVYSFGMVLLELLMNQLPAARLNGVIVYPILECIKPNQAGVLERVMQAVDPTALWPVQVAVAVATLALQCVSGTDSERPRFTEVCQTLRAIQNRFPPPQAQPECQSLSALNPTHMPTNVEQWARQRNGCNAHGPFLPSGQLMKAQPDRFLQAKLTKTPPEGGKVGAGSGGGSPGLHMWGSSSGDDDDAPTMRGVPPGGSSPSVQSDGWPANADLALEVAYIKGGNAAALPPSVRTLVLPPTVDASGRRVVRIGRNCQSQWFEALVGEPYRTSISRAACEVSWHEPDTELRIHVLGNTIVVDDQFVGKDKTAPLHVGSSLRFMYQGTGGDFSAFLTLLVRCASSNTSSSQRERSVTPMRRTLTPSALARSPTPPWHAAVMPHAGSGVLNVSPRQPAEATPNYMMCSDATPPGLENSMTPGLGVGGGGSSVVLLDGATPPVLNVEPYRRPASGKSIEAAPSQETWCLECFFAAGLANEALAFLPVHVRNVSFNLIVGGPSVVLGRQHQMMMFEALLARQKALLARVSRNHLQVDAARSGALQITNLSQNIVLAGARVLWRGDAIQLHSGETLSFAASTDMIPGVEACTMAAIDGVEKVAIGPFLSFRLSVVAGASVVTEGG